MLMSRIIHEKPQVLALAEALRLDVFSVVGRLQRVWAWADQLADSAQLVDGVLRPGTASMIDSRADRSGFARAMADIGWLELGDGFLRFPNSDDWLGREAKKRAAHAAKMKRWREDVTQNESQKRHRNVTRPSLEKRREEKSNYKTPSSPPQGDEANARSVLGQYPKLRRVGGKATVRAILRAAEAVAKERGVDRTAALRHLFERTRAYAASPAGSRTGPDAQFIPLAATWFNQGRYDDDPATWEVGEAPRVHQESTSPDAIVARLEARS